MHPGTHFRRNGWLQTEVLFRHASELLRCKCPVHLRTSRSLSSDLIRTGLQGNHGSVPDIHEAWSVFSVLLLHKLHEWCVLPAIRTLWNEGTVWLSSPSEVPNTTDSILSEGHGKTVRFLPTGRRTESPMSDGCTLAPEESQDHLLLPMQLPVQILRYDRFPSEEGSPGSALAGIRFQHLSL